MMTRRVYSIDDLPEFSPWPARLLGLSPWRGRRKTAAEVTREYEGDKWGPMLSQLRLMSRPTLADANRLYWAAQSRQLASIGPTLRPMSWPAIERRRVAMVAAAILPLRDSSALVELGAGYGAIVLALARRAAFRGVPMFAGEYAPSGVELMDLLAAAEGIDLTTGRCDFRAPAPLDFDVPGGATLLTCGATLYVPTLRAGFVEGLRALQPRRVVHVEPAYEHHDAGTLLGAMRRRYVQLNDYNRNLVSLLRRSEQRGILRIVDERPAVFGPHALLPYSVIAWEPTRARNVASARARSSG